MTKEERHRFAAAARPSCFVQRWLHDQRWALTLASLPLLMLGCRFNTSGSENLTRASGQPVPQLLENTAWKVQVGNCSYYHAFKSSQRTDLVVCESPEASSASYATSAIDTKTQAGGQVSLNALQLLNSSCTSSSSHGSLFPIHIRFHSGSDSDTSETEHDSLLVSTRVDPETGQSNSLRFTNVNPSEVTRHLPQAGCVVSEKATPSG